MFDADADKGRMTVVVASINSLINLKLQGRLSPTKLITEHTYNEK